MSQQTLLAEREADTKMATVVEITPLSLLQACIANGQDPDKMLGIIERMAANEAADRYGEAFATFQSLCPQIHKGRSIDLGGGKGPTYASLDDILRIVQPILAECGLGVSFSADITDDGKLRCKCFVRCGRHVEESEITLPAPTQMRVNDTQKMAAALSYAKRHCLCAALNIVVTDEDTDAVGVCETITEEQAATLREWIGNVSADEGKFLAWLGVKSLADVPRNKFDDAVKALKAKAKR